MEEKMRVEEIQRLVEEKGKKLRARFEGPQKWRRSEPRSWRRETRGREKENKEVISKKWNGKV